MKMPNPVSTTTISDNLTLLYLRASLNSTGKARQVSVEPLVITSIKMYLHTSHPTFRIHAASKRLRDSPVLRSEDRSPILRRNINSVIRLPVAHTVRTSTGPTNNVAPLRHRVAANIKDATILRATIRNASGGRPSVSIKLWVARNNNRLTGIRVLEWHANIQLTSLR